MVSKPPVILPFSIFEIVAIYTPLRWATSFSVRPCTTRKRRIPAPTARPSEDLSRGFMALQ
jgi:hypothetical protein